MLSTLEIDHRENIYDQFYYKKNNHYKKKFFCIGLLSVVVGYGLGILTCHLSHVC